ncbi:MAG: hypothetical protein EHM63_07895 [Actinobacteria bacterium]|nr:MAG: hypothetical protein EHM63_07895 [Actinomycetota bacterium]
MAPTPDDDDFLDGCDLSRLPEDRRVRDEWLPWLVLLADVDRGDRRALLVRAQEWRELFGGT